MKLRATDIVYMFVPSVPTIKKISISIPLSISSFISICRLDDEMVARLLNDHKTNDLQFIFIHTLFLMQ